MEYKFKINEFEGPLDLLLHLIKQSEMDIMDIEIVKLTDQYLEYINNMEKFNLNVARFGSIVIPAYRSTQPDYPFDLWQYTSTGSIAGIEGNVDMNKNPSDRFKKQYL